VYGVASDPLKIANYKAAARARQACAADSSCNVRVRGVRGGGRQYNGVEEIEGTYVCVCVCLSGNTPNVLVASCVRQLPAAAAQELTTNSRGSTVGRTLVTIAGKAYPILHCKSLYMLPHLLLLLLLPKRMRSSRLSGEGRVVN